ncbi:MAG: ribonuclease P protein component 2 [Candidatus Helarchaeota archaeon]|nr:ribonuclease P protein component 2 [Candidatus Helarchaeota archaeon]
MKAEKHRYIAFEIISKINEITEEKLLNTIWHQLYTLYGEHGTSKMGLWLMNFDPKNKKGILRCNLKELDKLRTALATITSFDRKKQPEVIFYIIGISGTIKTIKEKYFLEK